MARKKGTFVRENKSKIGEFQNLVCDNDYILFWYQCYLTPSEFILLDLILYFFYTCYYPVL